jgi:hypothetical protein
MDGDTWTIPLNVSRDSGDIRYPAIAFDGNGNPLVVWSEESYARLRYVRQMDDSWSVPKLTFSQSGVIPRLAVDSRGQTYLLFGEPGGPADIWYSRYFGEGDSWATPQVAASSPGQLGWHDVTVDRRDYLHAVWMDYGTNGLGYSFYNGTRWSTPEALPDPAPEGQSCDPRIATDADGVPHVVWQERSGGYLLYYACRTSDTWSEPFQFCLGDGADVDICLGAGDTMHVIWSWDYGVRTTAHCDTGWMPVETLDTSICFETRLATGGATLHAMWRRGGSIFHSQRPLVGVQEPASPGAMHPAALFHFPGGVGLRFSLDRPETVSLSLLNPVGNRVATRNPGLLAAGNHVWRFDNRVLEAGVYFCMLRMGSKTQTTKVLMTK